LRKRKINLQIIKKMKKYIYNTFTSLILLFSLSSCLKNDGQDSIAMAREQLEKDEVIIQKFIADNSIAAVRHESGLYYEIKNPGTGNVNYNTNPRITAHYTGRLLYGTVFDSSTGKSPLEFNLSGVIDGWKIGIPLIQKDGKIRLLIPSGYAYGQNGAGSAIGPNAVLDFDIEITDIK
jgi:FKBP-type peptidyl-prolyl cis-trans isomerase FkpA